jgi:hypothetical protein
VSAGGARTPPVCTALHCVVVEFIGALCLHNAVPHPTLCLAFALLSMLAIEQAVRDDTLNDEKIKIVRAAASVCFKQYHVNQAFKCRPIYVEYLRMIQHKNSIIHDYPAYMVSAATD